MIQRSLCSVILLTVFLLGTVPEAFPGNEYRSLDGYTVAFDQPGYSIEAISQGSGYAESALAIVTPSDDELLAFVSYRDSYADRFRPGELRGLLIDLARELYCEQIVDEQDESISMLFHSLASGQNAYRLHLSVGDHEHHCLGVDMTGSPGLAAAMLIAFPPWSEVPAVDQRKAMTEVLENLSIEFMDAAG